MEKASTGRTVEGGSIPRLNLEAALLEAVWGAHGLDAFFRRQQPEAAKDDANGH